MSDLISKADAIKAIDYVLERTESNIHIRGVKKARLKDAIKALPADAVQGYTEWLEKIIVEAETFEWLCEDATGEEWCEKNCNFASIQAECLRHLYKAEQVTSKLKKPCDSLLTDDSAECKEQKSKLDLISRADAVEAVKKIVPYVIDKDTGQWGILVNKANVITELSALPSADATQGEWIPCSERLPERGFGLHYLVTIKDGYGFKDDVYEAFFNKNGWLIGDNELADDEVIAWMPLPKPYREDGEE